MIDFTKTNISEIESVLIKARKENGFTQNHIAEKLGISRSHVANQEKSIDRREFGRMVDYVKAIGGSLYFSGSINTDPVKYMEFASNTIEKYKSGEMSANDALRLLSKKITV